MPAEAKFSLPGFAFAAVDEVVERLQAGLGRGDQHVRPAAQQREVGEVLQRVVGQLGVDARVGDVRRGIGEQRVAVGRRVDHDLRADRAAGAGAVLGHHRLAPHLLQLGRDHAADDVGRAARRERDDQADGLVGKALRENGNELKIRQYKNKTVYESPSPTSTFSGFSLIPDASACCSSSVAKSCSVQPCPIIDWIRSRVALASGIGTSNLPARVQPQVHVLAQQMRRKRHLEVQVDEGRRLVAREGRAHHALVHEIEEGVARHARLLREHRDLGQRLRHHAEEHVVADLDDARRARPRPRSSNSCPWSPGRASRRS